jgi:hypothetical protein
MLTIGIGLTTGVAVAQHSPELMETIGGSYKIGRVTSAGSMIVETVLYEGRPIATDYILPSEGASGPDVAAPSQFEGSILSGEMSGNYFILHRAHADGSVNHEIFLGGESIGSLLESFAVAARPGSLGNVSRTMATASTKPSTFFVERAGEDLVVHVVQPDGTRIRATSRNGGPIEQIIEARAGAVTTSTMSFKANSSRARASGEEVVPMPKTPTPRPSVNELKQSIILNAEPAAFSATAKPIRSTPPTNPSGGRRQAVRAANPSTGAAPGDQRLRPAANSYAAAASAARRAQPQRSVASVSAPRPQVHRGAPQRLIP